MFDRLLVRPTGLHLMDALTEAQAEANSRWHTLDQRPADWTREVAAVRGERSGRRIWSARGGACRATVRMAWWTDHRGGRHFRVRGLASVDDGDANPIRDNRSPPAVEVYPAVSVCRGRAGVPPAWVFVCACGEVFPADTPGGWMGTRCVACHDREQDGEPPPIGGWLHDLGPASDAAPLPDLERFLVRRPNEAGQGTRLEVCGLSGGTDPLDWEAYGRLEVSPDGRVVAILEEDRVLVRDWPDGAAFAEIVQPCRWLSFSPCGSAMALSLIDRTAVWGRDQEGGAWEPRREYPAAGCVVWSPDGTRSAAVGNNQLQVWRHDGQEMPFECPVEPVHAAEDRPVIRRYGWPTPLFTGRFTSDGDQFSCLWIDPGTSPRDIIVLAARWRWTGRYWTRLLDAQVPPSQEIVFSPDGRWLATRGVLVDLIDLVAGRSAGVVGWPGDNTIPPRFTPDSRSLVMGQAGRLRVVPWALLLGVPESAGG